MSREAFRSAPSSRQTICPPSASKASNERLRFFYQDPAYEGLLEVSRRPSRVSAESVTFTRLDREVLHSHLEATLEITGGGLRTLDVALSESAGENLRFRLLGADARIVEQFSTRIDFKQWGGPNYEGADRKRIQAGQGV